MDKLGTSTRSYWLLLPIAIAGLAARLLVATLGHNYDMDSWQIVAGIVDQGGNVYALTNRYNYGPVWFHVLHLLNVLAWHDKTAFRYLVAGFLSLIDLGIFFILWRRFGKLAATFFFLNPVSIIITGYHSQFDNLAVLFGLLAALLMGDEFDKPVGKRKLLGLTVLGISLATKHLLFAFPCWLAVKQKGMAQKVVTILIPLSIFGLSFVPYWHEGSRGILENVFLYRSFTNNFFYNTFVPQGVQFMMGSQTVWLLILTIFAFIYRQKNIVEFLLLYTCVFTATSPAMTNQYLAIPAAFVATHLNPFTILYTAFAIWHLLVDVNGFHWTWLSLGSYTDISIDMLCLGLIWVTWRQEIITLAKKCSFEINNQFHPEK